MRQAIVRKDKKIRDFVTLFEPVRNALRFLTRNNALPLNLRMKAQMELNQYPSYTRRTIVHDRCIETGRGRWIIKEFKLTRHAFRKNALEGLLPGVYKAIW